jgi:hypothetical protein
MNTQNTTGGLRIEKPCPFVPTKGNKVGDNFYCKSCSKTIIDFRGKSPEEIKCVAGKGVCGIFSLDQLPGQQRLGFFKQVLFYGLAALSLLGFSIKPVSAAQPQKQSSPPSYNSTAVSNTDDPANHKKKEKKKKGLFHKKKKIRKWRTLGCVDF